MYLFLLLALPILYYIFTTLKAIQEKQELQSNVITESEISEKENKTFNSGFFIFIGIFIAVIYCIIDFFVTYPYRITLYSVFSNFPHYFISYTLKPLLICGIIIFLLSKDKWFFKIKYFTPMLIGFYIIYLPYETISTNDTFDYFLLFIVPILYTTYILIQEFALEILMAIIAKKVKKLALTIVIPTILIALLLPAIIFSMYYTQVLTPLALILVLLLLSATIFLNIFSKKIQNTFNQ